MGCGEGLHLHKKGEVSPKCIVWNDLCSSSSSLSVHEYSSYHKVGHQPCQSSGERERERERELILQLAVSHKKIRLNPIGPMMLLLTLPPFAGATPEPTTSNTCILIRIAGQNEMFGMCGITYIYE